MKLFHRHKWSEVRRHFVAPVRRSFEGNMSDHAFAKLLSGYTCVESKCAVCGKIYFQEMSGDHT